jgi:diguanylate cyclase (GGDEF)-like protein
VAFSSSRGFREYSASRPNCLDLRVLRPDAPVAAVTAVIERALQQREFLPDPKQDADSEEAANTRRAIADLAARTMEIVPAPGVAVYLKEPGETKVRATVTWVSDAVMARAHHHLPGVIDRVLTTAEPLTVGAVGPAANADPIQNAYGLAGAPLRNGGEVVGAVCAFGDGPLAVGADALTRFDDLAAAFSWGGDGGGDSGEAAGLEIRPEGIFDKDETADIEWQPTLLERRRGEFEVARELARTRREQRQLSVVLFDVAERERASAIRPVVDDRLLNGVAETFVRAIRQSDLPIQWSGSELLLVLPGVAGVEARAVAERVRAAMQAGGQHRVAVAGGVAQLDADEQFGSVVRRARAKLTEARDRGHNRVS